MTPIFKIRLGPEIFGLAVVCGSCLAEALFYFNNNITLFNMKNDILRTN